ncbi:MAG: DUF423 domain-containing protein [Gammaproteobacteria bacterium]|nr:DUF423 domain-containing protein [Gammaproteobacteria bacterium]
MAQTFLTLGALNGLLAVALGALGAHSVQHSVSPQLYSAFETAVQYHGMHVPALLVVGLLALHHPSRILFWSGVLFLAGIFLFSGSLYLLALTQFKWLGPVTPVGGLSLMGGWLTLGLAAWRLPLEPNRR